MMHAMRAHFALATFVALAWNAISVTGLVPIMDYNYTGILLRDSYLDSVNAPQWIAKMKPGFTKPKIELIEEDIVSLGGTVRSAMYAVQMITFDSSAETLEHIRQNWGDRLEYLVPNMVVLSTANQCPQTGLINNIWGLDRIDQTSTTGDGVYQTPGCNCGQGVNVFILDTGVRLSHADFLGRTGLSKDYVNDDLDASDGNGHGTHCAGTAVGETYGVAKCATIHAVKVLSDQGGGSTADIIAAIDWIITLDSNYRPAVASMSLGGPFNSALNEAVDRLDSNGVTVVVAAGNSNTDACQSSPASASKAITVGSSDIADERSSFSNHGSCVDLYAPGSFIKSAYYRTDNDYSTLSGTSMAAPHVSGAVALIYEANPTFTPAEVKEEILAGTISITIDKGVVPLLNVESIDSCENKGPVDCVMSSWTSWSSCPAPDTQGTCGSPQRTRTRSVVTRNSCGGQSCPNSEESELCPGSFPPCPNKAPTKEFTPGPLDVNGTKIYFTPDGTSAYRFCVSNVSQYTEAITDAATKLSLNDDDYVAIQLPQSSTFIFYGTGYDKIYVGSNGYITFTSGDSAYQSLEDNIAFGIVSEENKDEARAQATLSTHFKMPRISVMFRDLNPLLSSGSDGVYSEIKTDTRARLVVTYNGIKCFSSRCSKSHAQAILFLDGSGEMELNYPSLLNGITYTTIIGLSPGERPDQFEQTNFADESLSVCGELEEVSLRLTLEGRAHMMFSEISFLTSNGSALPVTVTGSTSEYESGEFWSANAAADGNQYSCYATSESDLTAAALTFTYRGSIDDITSVRFSSNGCLPGGSYVMAGEVEHLTIEYKEGTQGQAGSQSWITLLTRSAVTQATEEFSDFSLPPPPLPLPPPSSNQAFVNALRTYKTGDTNSKTQCSGFSFQPSSAISVSALGWGSQNALSSAKTCTMWQVSDKSRLIAVTLAQGVQPIDGWIVGEAAEPYEQLDPGKQYRLVCCVAKDDGDAYNEHKIGFMTKKMENSSMLSISDIVSGKRSGRYPSKIVSRMYGAPTFFTGSVPSVSESKSATDELFGAGYSAAIPVTLTTVVEEEEAAIVGDVCLCSPPPPFHQGSWCVSSVLLLFEIGYEQAEAVAALSNDVDLTINDENDRASATLPDLASIMLTFLAVVSIIVLSGSL